MHLLRRILSTGLVTATLLSAAAVAHAEPELNEQAIEEGWQAFLAENGKSHAAGRDLDDGQIDDDWSKHPTVPYSVTELKVGIRYSYTPTGARSEFYSYNHPQVKLTGTKGDFQVIDQSTGLPILTAPAGDVITVAHDKTNYVVTDAAGNVTTVAGPVYFHSDDPENTFAVPSIVRLNILTYVGYLTPEYRGDMEVARGTATPAGTVNLVNHVELEQYLRGNVVNESPAFFHVEALKTQAVAARGYAVANIGRFIKVGYPFDIDDSAGSQVYRGKTSEHPNGDAAVLGTKGLVTTYNGKIITAYYSSSMGGHTESVEWSFSSLGNPAQAVPYLVGRYDGPEGTEPDLATEEGQREFWAGEQSQTYDSRTSSTNPRNRWVFTLSRAKLESNINARKASAIVISGSRSSIGTLQGCLPTQKSPSGRIVIVRCTGSNGVWEFRNWGEVRSVFLHPTWGTLNNPAFLDNNYNADGTLDSITVTGGGWGHNVGMSQYGANGRGKAGQNFAQILGFYFKDTVIGSHPIKISNDENPGPGKLKQEFATPDGHGVLELRPEGEIVGLHVTINNQLLVLNKADLAEPVTRIDISEYLTPGLNTIEYHPISAHGSVSATVVVYE